MKPAPNSPLPDAPARQCAVAGDRRVRHPRRTYSVITPAFRRPTRYALCLCPASATGQGLPVSAAGTQALWQQQGVQSPRLLSGAAALTAWIDQSRFSRRLCGLTRIAPSDGPTPRQPQLPDPSSRRTMAVTTPSWRCTAALLGSARRGHPVGELTGRSPHCGAAASPGGRRRLRLHPQFIFISAAPNDRGQRLGR